MRRGRQRLFSRIIRLGLSEWPGKYLVDPCQVEANRGAFVNSVPKTRILATSTCQMKVVRSRFFASSRPMAGIGGFSFYSRFHKDYERILT